MSVRKWNDDDVEYLIAYLDCNDDGVYDIWRVENKSKLVLVNRKDSAMNKYYEVRSPCYISIYALSKFSAITDIFILRSIKKAILKLQFHSIRRSHQCEQGFF